MFSYDPNQISVSRRDELRFLAGDTVAPGFLQDAEVDYLISQSTDNNIVMVAYCEAILNNLANEGTYDLGPLKVDNQSASDRYTILLKKYSAKLGTATPYMPELRESAFSVGMHSNKE